MHGKVAEGNMRRRIACVGSPIVPKAGGSTGGLYGAYIGRQSWQRGFAKYSQYEMEFFGDAGHRWSEREGQEDTAENALVTSILGLSRANECMYAAAHSFSLADWARTVRMRNRFFPGIPSTAAHQILSYPMAWEQVLSLSLGGWTSRDALLCSSRTACRGYEELFDAMQERIPISLRRPQMIEVPTPVDADRFSPRNQRDARGVLGWSGEDEVILWVGRYGVEDKADLLPLLQAFRLIRNERSRAVLRCVGKGRSTYIALLKELVAMLGLGDGVHIHVDVSPELMPVCFAASDVVVVPTDNVQETFGLVPVEASACGRPVVASDWDGYRGSVIDGVTGFLVHTVGAPVPQSAKDTLGIGSWRVDHLIMAQGTVIDMDELVRAVLRLLGDADLRQKFGAAGRQHVIREFGMRAVVEKAEAAWEMLRTSPYIGPERDMVAPDYVRVLGGYWTEWMKDDDVIEAREATLPPEVLYYYMPELDHVVPAQTLSQIYGVICEKQRIEVGAIGELVGVEHSVIVYACGWLAKQGYVRVLMA